MEESIDKGDIRTRQLVQVAMGAAALAFTGLSPSTPAGHAGALIVIVLAGVVIVSACRARLRMRGRADVALAWTALPLVEAALVTRLTLHGEPVNSGVAAAFALWGVIGCILLFRRLPGESEDVGATVRLEKTIMHGSDLK